MKIFGKSLAADMSLVFGMNIGQFLKAIGRIGIEKRIQGILTSCGSFLGFGAPRILFAVPKSSFIGLCLVRSFRFGGAAVGRNLGSWLGSRLVVEPEKSYFKQKIAYHSLWEMVEKECLSFGIEPC